MKFTIQNPGLSERDLMRKLGYMQHRPRQSRGLSYIRRAKPGGPFYPRYHLYVKMGQGIAEIDLHFDWRRPMHVKEARCSDNSGDIIDKEVARMQQVVTRLMQPVQDDKSSNPGKPKEGFWQRFFGK